MIKFKLYQKQLKMCSHKYTRHQRTIHEKDGRADNLGNVKLLSFRAEAEYSVYQRTRNCVRVYQDEWMRWFFRRTANVLHIVW